MLGISVIHGWYLIFGPGLPVGARQDQEKALLEQILFVEAIDTILVLVAIALASRPRPIRRSFESKAVAWFCGIPVLALLLGINIAYSKVIQEIIGKQPHLEVIEINFKTHFWYVLIAVCFQPAVVEELFFRYLALGHLRNVMGDHAAVWVSAVMFGMAHLGNPLGMPILIVVGAGLGYMRLASGGLILPMLMHFGHNVIVLLLEGKV
jgi:membrane protease YdiL (CAAX protease family)